MRFARQRFASEARACPERRRSRAKRQHLMPDIGKGLFIGVSPLFHIGL
jgi:hypothetical protein